MRCFNMEHNFVSLAVSSQSVLLLFLLWLFSHVLKIAKSDYQLCHVCLSACPFACLSVCLFAWNNSSPNTRILIKNDIWVFFEYLSKENSNLINSDKINAYFTWRPTHICDNISFHYSQNEKLFRQNCGENENIFLFINFFRKSCRVWDKEEKYCRTGQATYGDTNHAHSILDK